jgi:hypothetical protein
MTLGRSLVSPGFAGCQGVPVDWRRRTARQRLGIWEPSLSRESSRFSSSGGDQRDAIMHGNGAIEDRRMRVMSVQNMLFSGCIALNAALFAALCFGRPHPGLQAKLFNWVIRSGAKQRTPHLHHSR